MRRRARHSAQPLGGDEKPVLVQGWSPLTSDLGLIQVSPDKLALAFVSWQATLGVPWREHRIESGLGETFEALLPLSNGKRRRAFVATRSGWTVQFQNGI